MTTYSSFNSNHDSNQWLKNLSNIFQQFDKKRSISYGDVKKILNVFIEDTRWIHEPRLVRCKYALYLKLDDLIQKHKNKNQYIKYFNKVKLQLQCAEKGLVYIKTVSFEESKSETEFERLYRDSVEESKSETEFERLYGDSVKESKFETEFERLDGDSVKESKFERLDGDSVEESKFETEFERLDGDSVEESKFETKEFERLDGYSLEESKFETKEFEYTKKIDLSILSQDFSSIVNIYPIVCRL